MAARPLRVLPGECSPARGCSLERRARVHARWFQAALSRRTRAGDRRRRIARPQRFEHVVDSLIRNRRERRRWRARSEDIHVYADLDDATGLAHPEGFPQFMRHVRDVRRVAGTRYHWTSMVPPDSGRVDAVITADVPGELIAWRTVDDSPVQSAGLSSSSFRGRRHRVHVRMSFGRRQRRRPHGREDLRARSEAPDRFDLARFKRHRDRWRPRDSAIARQDDTDGRSVAARFSCSRAPARRQGIVPRGRRIRRSVVREM